MSIDEDTGGSGGGEAQPGIGIEERDGELAHKIGIVTRTSADPLRCSRAFVEQRINGEHGSTRRVRSVQCWPPGTGIKAGGDPFIHSIRAWNSMCKRQRTLRSCLPAIPGDMIG